MPILTNAIAADLTGGGALMFALLVLLVLAVPVTLLFGTET